MRVPFLGGKSFGHFLKLGTHSIAFHPKEEVIKKLKKMQKKIPLFGI